MTNIMRSNLKFHLVEEHSGAQIKVIGIGGGGGNAVNRMIEARIEGVEFIALNTDLQALNSNRAVRKIQIGNNLTKGLGSGGKPDIGKEAAMEDTEKLLEILEDTDMLFLTTGLGGGTGTGAAPIIANLAAEKNILTIAIVTLPFDFEGKIRRNQAMTGLEEIRAAADTVIAIPNERLLETIGMETSIHEAFKMADDVLRQAVQGISDLILKAGFINLDFADVKSIMKDVTCMMKGSGNAFMGTGMASGENRAVEAAHKAISSPLLIDSTVEGARGMLINITGGKDITMHEVSKASKLMHSLAHTEANIIFGIVMDESIKDMVKVTVIATGFDDSSEKAVISAKEIHDPRIPHTATPKPQPKEPTPPYLFEPKGTKRQEGIMMAKPEWEKRWEPYDAPSFLRNKNKAYKKTPNEIR
jgi:cell division protein FtsZ